MARERRAPIYVPCVLWALACAHTTTGFSHGDLLLSNFGKNTPKRELSSLQLVVTQSVSSSRHRNLTFLGATISTPCGCLAATICTVQSGTFRTWPWLLRMPLIRRRLNVLVQLGCSTRSGLWCFAVTWTPLRALRRLHLRPESVCCASVAVIQCQGRPDWRHQRWQGDPRLQPQQAA